ncbi:MAG: OmpA family protein [Beijerinckiaceae bacterium]|nr:OmpA family protein [Beijerinckiaceae bacterium]
MSLDLAKLMRALASSFLATGLALATGIGSALAAEQLSVDQIIKALTPKLTRGLTTSPAEAARNVEETQFLDTLRNRTTRSLTLDEREKLATFAEDKPSIDIDLNFEYNSSRLAPSEMSKARTIGEALSSSVFKGSTFLVEGHTDAKGGNAFNQRLSERRADTIKHFLVEHYRISPANLRPVGYGETKLKNNDDPFGAENRRVRVVNMANEMANK